MKELKIGKRNSTFQHILVIKNNRHKRFENKEIFVEGVRNIKLALKYGWKIKYWIYEKYEELSNWARQTIKQYQAQENLSLTKELMIEVSGKSNTSEIIAIFEMKKMKINIDQIYEAPLFVLFDRPSKKGNLGSIIRSADAFGINGIIVTGHSVDIYDPEIIGATMGSYFTIPIEKIDTNEEVLELFNKLKEIYPNLQIISTTELGEKNINEIDYKNASILMIGNESMGLSKFLLENSNMHVKIPMVGEASSFNAACAGSIFMYQAFINRNTKK